jgi:hypothetical protein
MRTPALSLVIILLLAAGGGSVAQDKGTLKPHALPPLANPDDPKTPAKELFGRKVAPTAAQHCIGFDDDPELRASLERLLRSLGIDAQQFASVSDFLASDLPDTPTCLVGM